MTGRESPPDARVAPRDALTTLRGLYTKSLTGAGGGQWFHTYQRVPDSKYEIIHEPDKCQVCRAFDQIESALLDAIEDGDSARRPSTDLSSEVGT